MKTYVTQEQFLTILHGVQNEIPRHRLTKIAGVSLTIVDAVSRYIHVLWHMGSMEEAQESEVARAAKQRVTALCTTEPDDNWYNQFAFVEPQTREVAMILNRQPAPKEELLEVSQKRDEQEDVSQQQDSESRAIPTIAETVQETRMPVKKEKRKARK